MPRLDDIALARLVAKGLAEQIPHALAGRQRRLVPGVAHVSDQADEIVFVRPHIPFGPSILRQISAEVAVFQLAFHQFTGDQIEFLTQRRIAGVNPGQGGRVQPFAHVLAIPRLATGALAVAFKQAFGVQFDEPAGFVGLNPLPHPAGHLNAIGHLKALTVSHHTRHFVRQRLDGLSRQGDRKGHKGK